MEHIQKRESIASHVARTFGSFRGLEEALIRTTSPDEVLEGTTLKDLLPTVENDFTRFKMWAGNQAAHRSGASSLDYRLREAPHLKQQVIYLLKDICESLEDASSKASGSSEPWDQTQEKGGIQNIQDNDASPVESAQDEEFDFSDSGSDSNGPTGVLSTLLRDVGEAIDCLLRLSVAIANPAPHERFRKFGTGLSEDVSFYEPHDIAYVRDKFPNITDTLATSLGKFITSRRQFFKYRRAHHEKLASGIETLASNKETDTCHTEVASKTIASSLPEQFNMLANFDPQAAFIDEDIRSDTGMSQTSYATSARFAVEGADQEVSDPTPPLKVPPQPSGAKDGIFECPFCYRMISAKTREAWKRHVFGDIRPYTCVLSPCTELNTDFDRLHNWKLHVSKYHWQSWSCPFKCHQPFLSATELSGHIKSHHFPTGTEREIKSVTNLGEKPAPEDTSSNCPLCGLSVMGLKKYVEHVGTHLEHLALFALPSLEIEALERGMGQKEEEEKEEETDSHGYDESHEDSQKLSEKALGKLPALSPHKVSLGDSGSQKSAGGSIGSEEITDAKLPKGLPGSKGSIDMANQAKDTNQQKQRHLDTTADVEPVIHQCNECSKVFKKEQLLRRHKLSHVPPNLSCPFQWCQMTFRRQDQLERHISAHGNQGKKSGGLRNRPRDAVPASGSQTRVPPVTQPRGGLVSQWKCCNCAHGFFNIRTDIVCPNCNARRCPSCGVC